MDEKGSSLWLDRVGLRYELSSKDTITLLLVIDKRLLLV
jgi:hypothetical protein